MSEPWRFAFASVRGTSHLQSGRPGQDVGICSVVEQSEGEGVLVACVSDGAGSAPRGEAGAVLACASFAEAIEQAYAAGYPGRPADLPRATRGWSLFVKRWHRRFRASVQDLAAAEGKNPREFACTFLAAVIEGNRAAFVQVGDGVIVVEDSEATDHYCYLFWPQRGEFANETHFVTETGALSHLESSVSFAAIREVALLTDGSQVLALDYANRSVHEPFFRGVFAPIRASAPGYSAKLSGYLAAFLDSPRVRSHTDDDKTLVLATRRSTVTEVENASG